MKTLVSKLFRRKQLRRIVRFEALLDELLRVLAQPEITAEALAALRAMRPDLEVLWTVPLSESESWPDDAVEASVSGERRAAAQGQLRGRAGGSGEGHAPPPRPPGTPGPPPHIHTPRGCAVSSSDGIRQPPSPTLGVVKPQVLLRLPLK